MHVFLIFIISLVISIILGRVIAHRNADDKRKFIGGVALLFGVVLAFVGIINYYAMGAQIVREMGNTSSVALRTIVWSIPIAFFGVVMLATKSQQS